MKYLLMTLENCFIPRPHTHLNYIKRSSADSDVKSKIISSDSWASPENLVIFKMTFSHRDPGSLSTWRRKNSLKRIKVDNMNSMCWIYDSKVCFNVFHFYSGHVKDFSLRKKTIVTVHKQKINIGEKTEREVELT